MSDPLTLLRLRQAQEKAKRAAAPQAAGMTGADAMRARGLASDPAATAEMNAQAEAAMRPMGQKVEDAAEQFGIGANTGIAGLLGLPMDALSAWGKGSLGMGMGEGPNMPGGSQDMQSIARSLGLIKDEDPRTGLERRARTLGEYAGPSAVAGAGLGSLAASTASGAASGLAAGQVRESGGGPVAEIAAALLAGGSGIAGANKIAKAAQTRQAIKAVPDIDDLKAQAGQHYEAGRATGATAPGALTQGLEARLNKVVTDAGLVAPDGTLAPKYADIGHAMKMARSYAGQEMNPEQMQQVRRALQAAAQSVDGNEARIGSQMLREFDDYLRNPLVPEFREGDRLYSRAMRGEEIQQAIDIARRGRRTAADTAISNEFQNLVRRGIRGDLTYPPDLEAAVERAANGSAGRQLASGFGKAAPTGIVSSSLGFGVPAAVTAPILGPTGALVAGGVSSGVGSIAKLLANRMAMGDARTALATALNGAPLAAPQTPEAIRRALIANLLATSAAQ